MIQTTEDVEPSVSSATLDLSVYDYETNYAVRNCQGHSFTAKLGCPGLADILWGHPMIEKLLLRGCEIGDAGADILAKALMRANAMMRELDLWFNMIGDRGAISIASALRVNRSLHSLVLRSNCFGVRGVEALASALRKNTILRSIDLSGNRASDSAAPCIATLFRENSTLQCIYLRWNAFSANGILIMAAALGQNSSIQDSVLSGTTFSDDDGTVESSHVVETSATLRRTKLNLSHIGVRGVTAIVRCRSVRSTSISFDASRNWIDEDAVFTVTDGFIRCSLKVLVLNYNKIGDVGAAALAAGLRLNCSVQILSLDSCEIGSTGCIAIAEMLHTNSTLQEIDMCHNRIDDRAESGLICALRTNTTLKKLDVRLNCMGTHLSKVYADARMRVPRCLSFLSTLKTFDTFNSLDFFVVQHVLRFACEWIRCKVLHGMA